VFEFLLVEWHVTPDYIVVHWTDELLELMADKLRERKERESRAARGETEKVPDEVLFNNASNLIEVKHGN